MQYDNDENTNPNAQTSTQQLLNTTEHGNKLDKKLKICLALISAAASTTRHAKRRKQGARTDGVQLTPAARAQLSRDTKSVERLRLLGAEVPTHLNYIDGPIEERRQNAQIKIDARQRPLSVDTVSSSAPPVRRAYHSDAGARTAVVDVTGSEGLNEQTLAPHSAPTARPRRTVPLVAVGVYMRQLTKARAQYASPITGSAIDAQTKGGRKYIFAKHLLHVHRIPRAHQRPQSVENVARRFCGASFYCRHRSAHGQNIGH